MNKSLSPVVLFVYNRPEHTFKTLESLKFNQLAKESNLIIFSDFPRSDDEQHNVNIVREIISGLDGYFLSVEIIFREQNFGLAKNIQEGISYVLSKYDSVIVLEDDLVTSPYFLNFMNDALIKYKDNEKVWHISGWNYPITSTGLDDAFFWRVMNCWGWGTWKNRWVHYDKNPEMLINTWKKLDILQFNLDGAHNFWSQVQANYNKKINTWAIFWYATIYKNQGLCVNPSRTYVINIGHDGSGENCGVYDLYKNELNMSTVIDWPLDFVENVIALNRIKKFYNLITPTIFSRIINRIKRLF